MKKKTGQKITIIGAGMAGTTLAALLGKHGIQVTVIDREDPNFLATETFDSRTVALSVGTKAVLEPLGVWDDLHDFAEPITSIDVQEGHDPFVLNFDAREKNSDGAFGWILPNTKVRKTLHDAAHAYGVTFVQGGLKDITQDHSTVTAVLADGTKITSHLLIGADGRNSFVRDLLGFDTVTIDYKQTALVGLITHEKPHRGLALERFYPEGPFAVLPFTNDENGAHRSAVVWTRHGQHKDKTLIPHPAELNTLLTPLLDDRYGTVNVVGKWAAYSLNLCHAKQFVKDRVVLISDAAHAMHPIAGQGLNVGMRDVHTLSELLIEAFESGDDIGASQLLQRYQRARRFDVMTMMAATDVLNRLFGNNIRVLRGLRSVGLGLVDRIPRLKKFFTGIATGT